MQPRPRLRAQQQWRRQVHRRKASRGKGGAVDVEVAAHLEADHDDASSRVPDLASGAPPTSRREDGAVRCLHLWLTAVSSRERAGYGAASASRVSDRRMLELERPERRRHRPVRTRQQPRRRWLECRPRRCLNAAKVANRLAARHGVGGAVPGQRGCARPACHALGHGTARRGASVRKPRPGGWRLAGWRCSGERLAEEAYDSDSGGYNHCQAQEQRLAHLRDEADSVKKRILALAQCCAKKEKGKISEEKNS